MARAPEKFRCQHPSHLQFGCEFTITPCHLGHQAKPAKEMMGIFWSNCSAIYNLARRQGRHQFPPILHSSPQSSIPQHHSSRSTDERDPDGEDDKHGGRDPAGEADERDPDGQHEERGGRDPAGEADERHPDGEDDERGGRDPAGEDDERGPNGEEDERGGRGHAGEGDEHDPDGEDDERGGHDPAGEDDDRGPNGEDNERGGRDHAGEGDEHDPDGDDDERGGHDPAGEGDDRVGRHCHHLAGTTGVDEEHGHKTSEEATVARGVSR